MKTYYWCPRRQDIVPAELLKKGARPMMQMDLFEWNVDPEAAHVAQLRELLAMCSADPPIGRHSLI